MPEWTLHVSRSAVGELLLSNDVYYNSISVQAREWESVYTRSDVGELLLPNDVYYNYKCTSRGERTGHATSPRPIYLLNYSKWKKQSYTYNQNFEGILQRIKLSTKPIIYEEWKMYDFWESAKYNRISKVHSSINDPVTWIFGGCEV